MELTGIITNNPDIVDINFGCPVYKIVDKGAGASCLKDLDMMERMAGTVVDAVKSKPVTVKTRLGWDDSTIRIDEVALMLQRVGVKVLTVHERLELCAQQLRLSVAHHGDRYGVIIMKKHYGQYLNGIHNGKKLRTAIMDEKEMLPIL